ncbi:MAG: HlyD family efflux transporter periplasmic adaptor subunit [Peptostreptococcaceae bacterium]|nr:HlyD family efflux transporter periplasmic adaptor subunit [Peptostreptococcaceae bacterium]
MLIERHGKRPISDENITDKRLISNNIVILPLLLVGKSGFNFGMNIAIILGITILGGTEMKLIEWIKIKKPKSKKKMVIYTSIAVLAVALFMTWGGNKGDDEVSEIIYTLAKGDIEISISGNGTVFSAESLEIDPDEFEAKVKKINFYEGDTVKAGEIIYELESDDLSAEWTKAKIAYENASLEYRTSSGDVSDLTVRAPMTGTIEEMDLEVGQTLSQGETVAKVWDKSEIYIKTPINLSHEGKIKVGQAANVTFPSSFFTTSGVVAKVEGTPSTDGNGGIFQYVYVSVDNPGGFQEGENVRVEIYTGSETIKGITNGTVEYKDAEIVEAPGKATVIKVYKQEKDTVKAGEIIAVLESNSLVVSQMSKNVSLQEAKIELDELADKVEGLSVKAESDGILAGQDVSVGDTVGVNTNNNGTSSNNTGVLGKIISFDKRMVIAVDELDINDVSIGQSAEVTVDAAPGEIFKGEVIKISELGNVQSGVATYDVTISVPYSKLVKEGMSADAEILLDSAENVLLLPIEAVTEMGKRKMVAVGSEEKTMVPVETGLMDARFYEVVGGLSEGDQVVLTGLATETSLTSERSSGIMPGMGGGNGGGGIRPNGK